MNVDGCIGVSPSNSRRAPRARRAPGASARRARPVRPSPRPRAAPAVERPLELVGEQAERRASGRRRGRGRRGSSSRSRRRRDRRGRPCAPGAKTPSSAGNTSGKTYVPQISTASACEVIARLWSPNMCPSWPRKSGWSAAMLTSEKFAPQTSAPSSSATRVSSACAPENAMPSPMIDDRLRARRRAARPRGATASPAGATRVSGMLRRHDLLLEHRVEHVHRQRDEHGPGRRRGRDLDRLAAARAASRWGRRPASTTSSPASPSRRGRRPSARPSSRTGRRDSPAITTSGAPPRFAWYIIPIPLPSPTPLCSCTTRRLLRRAGVAVGHRDRDRLLERRDVPHLRVARRARRGTPAPPCRGCRTCR